MPVAAAQVDQVGDLLENEEADAQRQDKLPGLPVARRTRPKTVPRRKSAYLNRPSTARFSATPSKGIHPRAPARTTGRSASWQASDLPAAAQSARPTSHRMPAMRQPPAPAARPYAQQRVIQRQHDRQKADDEDLRVEQHYILEHHRNDFAPPLIAGNPAGRAGREANSGRRMLVAGMSAAPWHLHRELSCCHGCILPFHSDIITIYNRAQHAAPALAGSGRRVRLSPGGGKPSGWRKAQPAHLSSAHHLRSDDRPLVRYAAGMIPIQEPERKCFPALPPVGDATTSQARHHPAAQPPTTPPLSLWHASCFISQMNTLAPRRRRPNRGTERRNDPAHRQRGGRSAQCDPGGQGAGPGHPHHGASRRL